MIKNKQPQGTVAQALKIDVQGFELHVLRGAERLLKENKGRLLVRLEFDPNLLRAAGTDPQHVLDFMKNLGYAETLRQAGDIEFRASQ